MVVPCVGPLATGRALLKEHSPARNQLPWKTHEKTKKTPKLQKLSTSASRCRETPSHKKHQKNFCDSGRPESLQERRPVRFGNRILPLNSGGEEHSFRESFENALALVRSVMLLLLCPTLGGTSCSLTLNIPSEPNELCR